MKRKQNMTEGRWTLVEEGVDFFSKFEKVQPIADMWQYQYKHTRNKKEYQKLKMEKKGRNKTHDSFFLSLRMPRFYYASSFFQSKFVVPLLQQNQKPTIKNEKEKRSE